MIQIKDHPVSQMYMRTVMPSWNTHGIKVILHDATTPKDLVYRNTLNFGRKRRGRTKSFTATEKSVWYSHFDLWCQCIKKGPLVIIEHDSMLSKPLPNFDKQGYKILSYMKNPDGVTVMSPSSGYYIPPPIAERLVARAVCQPVDRNSDGHLMSVLNYERQEKIKEFFYIEQIIIDGLNTIDHKSPYRTFIGLDYENIDIPSIHRQA